MINHTEGKCSVTGGVRALASAQIYVCMYVNTTIYRNFPILGRHYGKTKKDRDLSSCTFARHILNARTVSF